MRSGPGCSGLGSVRDAGRPIAARGVSSSPSLTSRTLHRPASTASTPARQCRRRCIGHRLLHALGSPSCHSRRSALRRPRSRSSDRCRETALLRTTAPLFASRPVHRKAINSPSFRPRSERCHSQPPGTWSRSGTAGHQQTHREHERCSAALTRVVTAIHATRGRLDPSGAAAWVVRRSSIFDLGLSRRNPLWRRHTARS